MRFRGNGIGPKVSPGSAANAFSWSAYWNPLKRSPFFALPETGLALMVGQEVTIYGDELIGIPIGNPLIVTYTCDIGSQSGQNYVINPVAGNEGDHTLRIVCKNGGYTIIDETITFTVYEEGVGTFKILRIGDSTMGGEEIAPVINTILNGCTITYLGTQGTTYKNEGYGGYSWNMFANNSGGVEYPSPFFKAGVLDITSYFTDNTIDVPNIVYIRLGINDVFSSSAVSGDGLTDAELTTIINNAKTLIDAFLAYNASLKIVIGLSSTAENTGAGWDNNYDTSVYSIDKFLQSIHKYNKGLTDTFANGTYNARVDCSYEFTFLDRNDGYPKTDGVHNNGVHPDVSGYTQLAQGLACAINKMLLGAEKIDQANWYKTSYWDVSIGANWSQSGNALASDGNNGAAITFNKWTPGKSYRIKSTITRSGGTYYPPYDGSTFSGSKNVTGEVIVNGYVPAGGASNIVIYSGSFNGTVTKISVKEILYP